MILRFFLVSLLLLGLAGFAAVAWYATGPGPAPVVEAPVQPSRAQYLVSARPLRAGSLVKPDDLTAVELPIATAPAGIRRDSREARIELIGSMIRRSLPAGDPMLADDVLMPGDRGFLASVLGPNMRAVSVGVDAVSGAAGLIWPGDRVDVLLTQQLNDDRLPPSRRVAGETVLSDVRVIAIDRSLVQGAQPEGLEPQRDARTVTLEVNQRQAERVAVAARLGSLSLSVRAASGTEAALPTADATTLPGPPAVTWGGDVSSALRSGPTTPATPAGPQTLQIFQGAGRREEFRF